MWLLTDKSSCLEVTNIAFNGPNQTLISGSNDGAIKLWNLEPHTGSIVLPGHKAWVNSPAFSPDGAWLISVDYYDVFTRVCNVQTGESIASLPGFSQAPLVGLFSSNGQWLAVGSNDGTVALWNPQHWTRTTVLSNAFEAGSLSFSADNRLLAVGGLAFSPSSNVRRLAIWNLDTFQETDKLSVAGTNAAAVCCAHSAPLLAVGYFDGAVRLWNYKTGKLLREFKEHTDLVWSLAFSRNDLLLASGSADSRVALYDLTIERAFPPLSEHSSVVWSVAFSPDSKTLASASNDGTIKLWSIAAHASALTLQGHVGGVSGIAFSPDGAQLASTGADGTVRLWPATSFTNQQKEK
jgi:WD40 repeat protein